MSQDHIMKTTSKKHSGEIEPQVTSILQWVDKDF